MYAAQEARRQGLRVAALGIQGWADPSLAGSVDAYEEVAVGQLGRLIERLKFHGVRQAIMAGKVTKEVLFDQRTAFDADALSVIGQVKDFSVPGLLGAIAARLATEGITLLDSSTFLKSSLCPEGALTARKPTPAEQEDIRVGFEAARTMAGLDVGQTVVVKSGVIVAVEAVEGTDAAIRRAHELAGQGLVVVKSAAPAQDRRFDLPVIGMGTITTLSLCGASCLAMEAGATLLLERERVIAAANAASIGLVGITPPALG